MFINEIHYDNDGADFDEGVELLGPLSTDLSSYRLELYNGNGGARYGTANYIPAGAALSPVGSGFGALWVPTLDLQNGSPDGIALFNGSGLVGGSCWVDVQWGCYIGREHGTVMWQIMHGCACMMGMSLCA